MTYIKVEELFKDVDKLKQEFNDEKADKRLSICDKRIKDILSFLRESLSFPVLSDQGVQKILEQACANVRKEIEKFENIKEFYLKLFEIVGGDFSEWVDVFEDIKKQCEKIRSSINVEIGTSFEEVEMNYKKIRETYRVAKKQFLEKYEPSKLSKIFSVGFSHTLFVLSPPTKKITLKQTVLLFAFSILHCITLGISNLLVAQFKKHLALKNDPNHVSTKIIAYTR